MHLRSRLPILPFIGLATLAGCASQSPDAPPSATGIMDNAIETAHGATALERIRGGGTLKHPLILAGQSRPKTARRSSCSRRHAS
jgi:hypothetical protein